MKESKTSIILITATLATALLVLSTSGVLGARVSGNLKALNIELYADLDCKTPITNIHWDNIIPGSRTTFYSVFIKNTANTAAKLDLQTTEYNPQNAQSLLSISWNRNNHTLNPGQTISADLTLTASSSIGDLSNFSFTIIISGTAIGKKN